MATVLSRNIKLEWHFIEQYRTLTIDIFVGPDRIITDIRTDGVMAVESEVTGVRGPSHSCQHSMASRRVIMRLIWDIFAQTR